MRIIDADKFKEYTMAAALNNGTARAAEKATALCKLIDAQPTIPDGWMPLPESYKPDTTKPAADSAAPFADADTLRSAT